jgi:selenide,water dikinase
VLFNSVRAGKYDFKTLERETLPIIASLNGAAMELALKYEVHACTDVTGFGILGHSLEMSLGSHAHICIDYKALPIYNAAPEMYKKGETTGSNKANRAMVARSNLKMSINLKHAEEELLYDPQTSGGLLLALPAAQAGSLLRDLHNAGIHLASRVGEVTDSASGLTVR